MTSLKGKLGRLSSAGPGSRATSGDLVEHAASTRSETPAGVLEAAATLPEATRTEAAADARVARIAELRARIHAVMARPAPARSPTAAPLPVDQALPFVREQTDAGVLYTHVRSYDVTQRHGAVALHTARDARGDAVATLALDPSLRGFDPSTALYLDTETTGVMGGTGTLPFLVGIAHFEGRRLRVEQYFVAEPCDEPAMLERLAPQIAAASALVTYNGKAFDLPLLRSRYVMARLPPPREPPHFDLLHAARRVYGARVATCRLTSLERAVLGFQREDDVPSGEIPARYVHFLRSGDAAPLMGVVEHNAWDVVAMAALLGELCARTAGGDASGRFEPLDMTGLARTAFRAGATALATALADDAAEAGVRLGQPVLAARARTLVARAHQRRGDHLATHRALLAALALQPDDAATHLSLAKLYEHQLHDPERALVHARASTSAEPDTVSARRIARLMARVARQTLRLPGVQ